MFGRLFERYRLHVREARFLRLSLLLAAGLNVFNWGLLLWFVAPRLKTSSFFALHYTIYFGVDQIGSPWKLLGLPLLGTGILVVNAILSLRYYRTERLASALLMAMTLTFESLVLLVSFLTILLNI